MTNDWRRRLRRAAVAALAAAPAACGLFRSDPPPPCPRAAIVADVAQLTKFRQGPGRDLIDVEYAAEIRDFGGSCEYRDKNRVVSVVTTINVIAELGPAAPSRRVSVPYFVAIIDGQNNIVAKSTFDAAIDFPEGRRRAGVSEETEQRIPLPAAVKGIDYEVLIGLQLTPDQVEFNRRKRGF
jgi:hypothetical protein